MNSSAIDRPLTLGIIIPHLYDSYQELILKGIIQKVKSTNFSAICYAGGAINLHKERHKIRNELYDIIDPEMIDVFLIITGPLITASGTEGLALLKQKIKGKPAISIGIEVPSMYNILVDNRSGLASIMEHLIESHKCRNIAFISGPILNDEARTRFETYKEMLEKYSIPFNPAYVYEGTFAENDGIDAYRYFHDEQNLELDAIIGADDISTSFLLEDLQKRGVNVPDDLIVVGFDDIESSQYTTPPLTTVHQPIFKLGYSAVELAEKIISQNAPPAKTVIPTHLITRNSCGCGTLKLYNDLASQPRYKQTKKLDDIKSLDDLNIDNSNMTIFAYEYQAMKYPITAIIQGVIKGVHTNSVNSVLKLITTYRQEILKEEISISAWTNILSATFGALSAHAETEAEKNFIAHLWSLVLFTMYQEESFLQAHEKDLTKEWAGRLQRIGDRLTTTFEQIEVLDMLYENLSLLNIHNSAIAIHKRGRDMAELIFSLWKSKQVLPIHKKFESKRLHPDSEFFQHGRAYAILPLLTENEQFGFSIFEIDRIDGKMYEDLAGKIATALKNVELMKKLNKYTNNLEKEVHKRTIQLQKANKLLKIKSYKDQLSGLMNRRYLMEVLVPEATLLQMRIPPRTSNPKDRREADEPSAFGVLIIDIDFFKKVNDTYGHYSGDMIIQQFSYILKTNSRDEDFIIRFGGEEFLVILKHFNPDFLFEKAQRIRQVVENFQFEIESGEDIKKTCSIGCISYPVIENAPDKFDLSTAINLADKGLYHAKDTGRNKVVEVILKDKVSGKSADDILNNFTTYVDKGLVELKT